MQDRKRHDEQDNNMDNDGHKWTRMDDRDAIHRRTFSAHYNAGLQPAKHVCSLPRALP